MVLRKKVENKREYLDMCVQSPYEIYTIMVQLNDFNIFKISELNLPICAYEGSICHKTGLIGKSKQV